MKTSAARVIAAGDGISPEAEPYGKNGEANEKDLFEALFHV